MVRSLTLWPSVAIAIALGALSVTTCVCSCAAVSVCGKSVNQSTNSTVLLIQCEGLIVCCSLSKKKKTLPACRSFRTEHSQLRWKSTLDGVASLFACAVFDHIVALKIRLSLRQFFCFQKDIIFFVRWSCFGLSFLVNRKRNSNKHTRIKLKKKEKIKLNVLYCFVYCLSFCRRHCDKQFWIENPSSSQSPWSSSCIAIEYQQRFFCRA